MRLLILLVLSFLPLTLLAQQDYEQEQLELRIKPIGKVRIEGKDDAKVSDAEAKKVVSEPANLLPGQATYDQFCSTCHRGGLAGAPKFEDAADWKPRLATKNVDQLLATAIKGVNAMPAKGTCSDCTDAQLKEAIQYMLPKK